MEQCESIEHVSRLCQQCAEYRQRSPHPSRPHLPASVDLATWFDVHRLFESLKVAPVDDTSDANDPLLAVKAEALTDLCMYVRNAAAMDNSNQDVANGAGIIGDVRRTISDMVQHDVTCSKAMRCVTVSAQTLSNLVTGNRQLQQSLVEQELTTGVPALDTVFSSLLTSANSQTNTAGLVLLLNCLKDNPETTALLCRTEAGCLVANRVGVLFGNNEDDESDSKTMLYVILSQIIEYGELGILLSREPDMLAYGLLDALAVYCNEQSATTEYEQFISRDLIAALTRLLSSSHDVLVRSWENSTDAYSSESDIHGNVDIDDMMSAHRCLAAIVSIFGTLTTDGGAGIIDWILDCQAIHKVIALLGLLNKHLPQVSNARERQRNLPTSEADPDNAESVKRLFMFKCDLIRIIGNVGYKSTAAQDLVRELGGLALVLDHMKIDDNHPFIREYAVVALKGLLHNNSASQGFVREMSVVEAAQNPELARAGLQAFATDDGRVSVKRVAPDARTD
ncbi:Ataxin-10 [Coemansia sp. RSA 2050]|nr:Ataxin-10 [Coemansia sp. RSA 2050]KAJ2736105.1 Ataxin-10 [Coemansia sp. BCRC 34962]